MELIIIFILVLLNGLFAMSELSLVSARKFKLENARKRGHKGAETAIELADNPTKLLSTVQIGITLIGILLGVYSGENLTNNVQQFLVRFSFIEPYSKQVATALVVIFITYISIVLGELFPKRLGMTFPEPIAMVMARPMKWLSILTSPFVALLTFSNQILSTIFGIKKSQDSIVSEEEIKSLIAEGTEGGEIQEIEQDIVERVFELGDRKVSSLFTHRTDIVYFDVRDTLSTIKKTISEEPHSAYPVCREKDIDQIDGIVLIKELFGADESDFNLKHFIRQAIFINENATAFKVLERFKEEKIHYAVVVNEFGNTVGFITMDDLLDALVGDATPQDQTEYSILQRAEDSWLADGLYNLNEFKRYFELSIDEEALSKYATLAGFLIHLKNDIPVVGETFYYENLKFEIMDKDGQRIDKVLISKIS